MRPRGHPSGRRQKDLFSSSAPAEARYPAPKAPNPAAALARGLPPLDPSLAAFTSAIVLEAGRVATEKRLDYYRRMGIRVTPEMTLAPEPKRRVRKKAENPG